MGDHDEAAKAEEVAAAVRVRIEPCAKPSRGGADEQAAELASRRAADLRPQRLEDAADRALERLERDVAGEAVADDDVGVPLE